MARVQLMQSPFSVTHHLCIFYPNYFETDACDIWSGHAYVIVVVEVSGALLLSTVLAEGPNTQVGSSVMCHGCCQPSSVPSGAVTVTVIGYRWRTPPHHHTTMTCEFVFNQH